MVHLVSQGNGVAVFEGGGQQLTIDSNACIMCEECEIVCPYSAIFFEEGYVGDGNYEALAYVGMKFKTNDCDLQGDCVAACPMNALTIESLIPDPPEFEPGEGEAPFRNIINNLTTPCLSNVFTQINNSDSLQTDIGHMLHDVFNIWDQANFTIGESNSLPPDRNGQTSSTNSGDYFNSYVTLNTNTLPGTSKEYIAGTIYHEIVHAYLHATGKFGNMQNHIAMAQSYIAALTDTLRHYFPGLSSIQAEAIAWVGLDETDAWDALHTGNLNKYNQLVSLQEDYRTGTKGTLCP
jgi:ferredoxin